MKTPIRLLFAIAFAAFSTLSGTSGAYAVNPDEMLADPGLEARARAIGKDLRCLVCQNESIDESDADLARDLRLLVRERLTEGDADEEVMDYIVARYGDYVLLNPPVRMNTFPLWGAPALLMLLGFIAVSMFYRGRRTAASKKRAPLSKAERKRLDSLLKQ